MGSPRADGRKTTRSTNYTVNYTERIRYLSTPCAESEAYITAESPSLFTNRNSLNPNEETEETEMNAKTVEKKPAPADPKPPRPPPPMEEPKYEPAFPCGS